MILKFYKIIKKSSFLWNVHYLFKFYRGLLFAFIFNKKIVLSRSACLGQELFEMLYGNKNYFLVSMQKMRCDVFLNTLKSKNHINTSFVRKFLTNESFLFPFIQEQKYLNWLKVREVDFFMIDSFSELVDKKFFHKKDNYSFCCCMSDILNNEEFNRNFDSFGLLEIEEIRNVYNNFFDWLELRYPNKHVIFIHYPSTLDGREFYKKRGDNILRVMKEIEQERKYIHNLFVEDGDVGWTENDDNGKFPYHYSEKTMNKFIEKWKDLNIKIK